jgi:hypothetical protein
VNSENHLLIRSGLVLVHNTDSELNALPYFLRAMLGLLSLRLVFPIIPYTTTFTPLVTKRS